MGDAGITKKHVCGVVHDFNSYALAHTPSQSACGVGEGRGSEGTSASSNHKVSG